MPTTKGKSKSSKAKKTSNIQRRAKPTGGKGLAGKGRAVGKPRGGGTARRTTGRAGRAGGGNAATARGSAKTTNVAIGSSPPPIPRPAREAGQNKAGDEGAGRVRIL